MMNQQLLLGTGKLELQTLESRRCNVLKISTLQVHEQEAIYVNRCFYFTEGVCKDILTLAGAGVAAKLKAGENGGSLRHFSPHTSLTATFSNLFCFVCSQGEHRRGFCVQAWTVPL